MNKTILIILISSLLFACGESSNSSNSSISGTLSNSIEGDQIYLDYLTPSQILTKDTATLDTDGNYYFDYQIEELGYYRLRINDQNFVNLILSKGETPIINGDGTNLMDTYTIEGSDESNQLKRFNQAYKANAITQDSLGAIYQSNPNDPTLFAQLQQIKFQSTSNMNGVFINIIDANPASLVSLAAVQQLDSKTQIDLYKKVDDALLEIIPENPWYINFHKQVQSFVTLYVGEPAPDFTLNDVNGKAISLSSLKGKIVLIDFWASWCRPCRAENPNVVKAYNEYSKKGFDVLSVSLDGMARQQNAKQDWITAIEKDGLIWENHVSDLKGWQSSVVPLYGIQGIPFTLLVDKDGIILGKNLRGQELEKKLASIF